ncbi:MAG: formylmethanofuran dehydrogenase subunit B [Thermodesulfobacteriota bacterium]
MSEILYESVVCPSCGCLCDDIDVVVEENRVKSIRNVCEWGINKFLFTKKFTSNVRRGRVEKPMIRGKTLIETDYETAISRAVDILQGSKKPLIYGLTNSGYNAQKIALNIARRLKGLFEPRGAALLSSYYAAMGNSNFYVAPLEEIRNNADLIIYWGCNPIHSTPRHLARYSVYPRGRCKERGSQDRVVFTVDVAENEMGKLSRQFLQVERGTDFLAMETMMKLLRGESVEDYKGDIVSIENMVKYMTKVSYGTIFFGLGLSGKDSAKRNVENLMALVKELNSKTRFVILPLYDDFNTSGVIQLLIRELKSPMPVDFSGNYDANSSKYSLLENIHEIDAALIVGDDPFWSLPSEKSDFLKEIPVVLIDPFWTRTTSKCQVVFPTAVTGIEAGGIAYRMDGLPLKLKKVMESEYPSDERILGDIYQRL